MKSKSSKPKEVSKETTQLRIALGKKCSFLVYIGFGINCRGIGLNCVAPVCSSGPRLCSANGSTSAPKTQTSVQMKGRLQRASMNLKVGFWKKIKNKKVLIFVVLFSNMFVGLFTSFNLYGFSLIFLMKFCNGFSLKSLMKLCWWVFDVLLQWVFNYFFFPCRDVPVGATIVQRREEIGSSWSWIIIW